jgi:hypothetical protein
MQFRSHLQNVFDAAKIGREIAAATGNDHLQIGMAVEGAAKYQMIGDDVLNRLPHRVAMKNVPRRAPSEKPSG